MLPLVMPRQARLDAPDTLHHVMVRGIERTAIFRDDVDRDAFMTRVAALADAGTLTVFAWALLPNHAHLLVRTGSRPLPRSMRSLLTGYAGAFNRRHKRVGHLFQNRYKSIVVEAEAYLLELVRYVHLNPLRAQVVPDLRRLGHYPWTGHSALLGTVPRPWQDTWTILSQFGPTPAGARVAYRAFVAAGVPRGHRPEFQGGGLLRSQGGWAAVAALRRGREAYRGDERILGSTDFVEAMRQAVQRAKPGRAPRMALPTLVARICRATGISLAALQQGSRRASVARAREGLAYLAIERYGYSGVALRDWLGVGAPSIVKAAQRGRAAHTHWDLLLVRERKHTRQ
jgi:REP element-mobilizing transposase RayT